MYSFNWYCLSYFGTGKRERNDSGKISGADWGRPFGVFGIAFGLQFLRGKKYIVGLVISILVDLILVGGIFRFIKQTSCWFK